MHVCIEGVVTEVFFETRWYVFDRTDEKATDGRWYTMRFLTKEEAEQYLLEQNNPNLYLEEMQICEID